MMYRLLKFLISPLGVAWTVLVFCIAGVLMWCSISYTPSKLSSFPRMEVDIPPYDAQKIEGEHVAETSPSDTMTPHEAGADLLSPPAEDSASVSPDNHEAPPYERYALSVQQSIPRPCIAIVVTGFGLNESLLNKALSQLPQGVTLCFSPYGNNLDHDIKHSYEQGRENIMMLPMEQDGHPQQDLGPLSLQMEAPWSENEERLGAVLSPRQGLLGTLPMMGTNISINITFLEKVTQHIKKKGILVFDPNIVARSRLPEVLNQQDIPFVQSDVVIDKEVSRIAIQKNLEALENLAKERGYAVGTITAYPLTFEVLRLWAEKLGDRQITLVPLSGILKKRASLNKAPVHPRNENRRSKTKGASS